MIYYLEDRDLNQPSAVLRVWGPDANTYLQGQFTQDLRIPPGASAYGLWLSLKGKVQGDSQVLKRAENDYLIVTHSLTAAELQARLESHLIADEVQLEDRSGEWHGFLLWGEESRALVPPPDGLAFPSRRAGSDGRQWMAASGGEAEVREQLGRHAQRTNAAAATLARLRAGIPSVPGDIGPSDLPGEGGLDDAAISYTKGCYLGQEVMARLKNLGQLRRRLHLVRGTGFVPVAGTELFQGGRRMGEIRTSAIDGEEFLALAMLSLGNLEVPAGLALASADGAHVTIQRRV